MVVSCAKILLVKFDPVQMLPSNHGVKMDIVGTKEVNYMAACR